MSYLLFLEPSHKSKVATQADGIELCKLIHQKITGYFPALTGGLLYKDGDRKDIDIVLYRHRQNIESFETCELEGQLATIGIHVVGVYGFVTKAKWNGFDVDIFNPETKVTKLEHLYGEE